MSDGTKILYKVVEDEVPGYNADIAADASGFVTIKNTIVTTSLNGTKTWNVPEGSVAPTTIDVQVMRNGEAYGDVRTVDVSDGTWSIDGLPAVDKTGAEYTYTAVEVNVPEGYEASASGTDFVNTLKTTEVSGHKIWNVTSDDKKLDSVNVTLSRTWTTVEDGVEVSHSEIVGTQDATAPAYEYAWTGLAAYTADGLHAYTYNVDETTVPAGFTVSAEEGTYNLINTEVGEKIDVTGTKTWNAPASEIPESVTVILLRNGEPIDSVVVSAADSWSYGFYGLDTVSADGLTKYTYTVDEVGIAGFTKNVVGFDLVNTITGKTSVTASKTWAAPDGTTLPESIEFSLYKDGTFVESATVTAADGYTKTWSDLDKYDANGEAISYSVAETKINDSQNRTWVTTSDGNSFTNTITGTTEISGQKTWNVPAGTQLPESITVTLLQNGSVYDTQTVTAKDDWAYSWTGLPKYSEDGLIAYDYAIGELEVPGYKTTVNGTDLVNTITGTTSVSGEKIWRTTQAESSLPAVTVTLYQNGEKYAVQSVSAEDNWQYSWTDLPLYSEDGLTKYAYTVDETNVPSGYTSKVEGTTLVNTELTSVSGQKTWKAPESVSLPDSITVILKRNGEQVDTKTVTAANNWSYSWDNLPVFSEDGATQYTYTVDEALIDGWTLAIDGTNLINTITGKTSISGTKTWNVPEGTVMPEFITVALLQNGVQVDTLQVSAADEWSYAFTGLDKYDADGVEYAYSVTELDVPAGYSLAVDGNNLINTASAITTVSGAKTWNVPEGESLPAYIKVNLLRNGSVVETKLVTAETNWEYSWQDLPSFSEDGLTAYTYTVEEQPVDGYVASYAGYNIANTRTETTLVSGQKTWNVPAGYDLPESITVNLLRNGETVDSAVVTAADNWAYSFDNLPKYSADGKTVYTYTVSEDPIDGFTMTIDGADIINTATGTTTVAGSKTWIVPDGVSLPDSITVKLMRNGEQVDVKTVTATDTWSYEWNNLPAFSADGKTAYTYTVEEDAVAGFETTVEGFNITNKASDTVSVNGEKVWHATAGADLPSVEVNLLRDGVVVDSATVSAANNWKYAFNDLAKYDEAGTHTYAYTVEEASIPQGFSSVVDGTTIVNSQLTSVSGVKTWNAPEGEDLPESITVVLNRSVNGGAAEAIDYKVVTADDAWAYAWTDLPVFNADASEQYTYSVSEIDVANYAESVSGTNLINTREGTTEVHGQKIWNVPANADLPDSVTVVLLRNGVAIDSKTVTAQNGWKYDWTDLAQYSEDGKTVYEYTVDESDVPAGYSKSIVGANIINTASDTTTVSGEKTWNVPEGYRLPASITVNLLRNGEVVDSAVVTAASDWTYSWTDLPLYSEDGKTAYSYSVDEQDVAGFNKSITGYNIANTVTGTTSVNGSKTWNVPEGVTAPDSITVALTQNGSDYGTYTLAIGEDGAWSISDLPAYSEDGLTAYSYEATEIVPEGYENVGTGTAFVNEYVGASLTIYKNITGDLSASNLTAEQARAITFEVTGPNGFDRTVTYADFVDGAYTFEKLVPGEYHVVESENAAAFADYRVNATGSDQTIELALTDKGTVSMTNDYTEVVSIAGQKIWQNRDGSSLDPADLPGSVTVRIQKEVNGVWTNVEGVPDVATTAADNWAYQFDGLDKYDDNGNEIAYHVIEVAIAGDKQPADLGYVALYDQGDGYDVVNVKNFVEAQIDFTKFYYTNDTALLDSARFSFMLDALDAAGNVRTGAAAAQAEDGSYLDDGSVIQMHAIAQDFDHDTLSAKATFNSIRYEAAGTYTYKVYEADAEKHAGWDTSVFTVTVEVSADAQGFLNEPVITYTKSGVAAENAFYNNQAIELTAYGLSADSSDETAERMVWVDPKVRKSFTGGVLSADQFTFGLWELDATGSKLNADPDYTQTNDAYGLVDFDLLGSQNPEGEWSLFQFTEVGDHWYAIEEIVPAQGEDGYDATVEYDTRTIYYNINVFESADGSLSYTNDYYDAYKGNVITEEPTFTNKAKGVNLRVKKTDSATGEELAGATYGLYLSNTDGNDAYLGSGVSDGNGWIEFEDIVLEDGANYYFKEEAAPEGYLVNAYRSGLFTIDKSADGYKLVYETGTASALAVDDTLTYEGGSDGTGVSDSKTTLTVAKLDYYSHDYVEGAKLAILDGVTGATIVTWTTDSASETFNGVLTGSNALEVDHAYILRELNAPDGYNVAADVCFYIDTDGAVQITSGSDGEMNGSTGINLYDHKIVVEKTVTDNDHKTVGKSLTQTGDMIMMILIGVVILIIIVAVIIALVAARKRKNANDETGDEGNDDSQDAE